METQELDAISKSVKDFTDATKGTLAEQSSRLLAIEQKLTAPSGARLGGDTKSIGAMLIESDGFKALAKGAKSTGQIPVGQLHKDLSIVNAPGLDQPLVPMYRVPGIIMPGQQRLTIRDLMPSFPTDSNMIAFARETGFVNSAAPQQGENVLKAQSSLTFALLNAPVQTLAHWIAASRQIIDDAPALEAYVNARLLYFLKLLEEHQLLNGDGIGSDISGLIANSTAYNGALTVAGDTFIDTLLHAITQTQDQSLFECDGIVLNNIDWAELLGLKDSLGRYLYGEPGGSTPTRLWNLPVVATKSMQRGGFLVGAFRLGAAIWDRADATVEVSREHADFFVRNMIAILVESRLALTVFRPLALTYGSFPFSS